MNWTPLELRKPKSLKEKPESTRKPPPSSLKPEESSPTTSKVPHSCRREKSVLPPPSAPQEPLWSKSTSRPTPRESASSSTERPTLNYSRSLPPLPAKPPNQLIKELSEGNVILFAIISKESSNCVTNYSTKSQSPLIQKDLLRTRESKPTKPADIS